MSETPELSSTLTQVVAALKESGLPYALIGGLAVILRGYDRSTRDVDLVALDLDGNVERFIEIAGRHGLRPRPADPVGFAKQNRIILLESESETGVDISMGFLPFEEATIDRATIMEFSNGEFVSVASVEDLVIMKLIAGRPRDYSDIANLVELYPTMDRPYIRENIDGFAEILERPDLVEQLESRLN